jgi:hypothetical protein
MVGSSQKEAVVLNFHKHRWVAGWTQIFTDELLLREGFVFMAVARDGVIQCTFIWAFVKVFAAPATFLGMVAI